jgi:hypothetical protein
VQEYIYSFKYGEEGITFEVNASSRGKAKDKFSSADAKVRDRGQHVRCGADDVWLDWNMVMMSHAGASVCC